MRTRRGSAGRRTSRGRGSRTARLLVNIDVDDLERGIAFYTRGLGLTPGRRLGAGACEMLGGTAAIYLLQQPAGSRPFAGASAGRDYGRHWTPVHLDFVVADVAPAVERAVAAGARLERPIQDRPWGRLARLSDPFGHGFCLLQFTGRGYDAIATGGRGWARRAGGGAPS